MVYGCYSREIFTIYHLYTQEPNFFHKLPGNSNVYFPVIVMDNTLDASYYLGGKTAEASKTLDIVIGSGDIVTIDELPDDPQELISFLEGESCAVKYWILVAQAYARARKFNEAIAIAEKGASVKTKSDRDRLLVLLSSIHFAFVNDGVNRSEHVQKALEALAQVEDSNDVPALVSKAILHVHKDEAESALQLFDRLLKLDSTNCIALLGKAQVTLSKTQNYSNALKIYQQVLVLNPLMKPDPRIGIGLCFWYLKDRSMAINSWKRALEIDPDNYKAKLLLTLAKFDEVFTNSLSDEQFIEGYKSVISETNELHQKAPTDKVLLVVLASYFYSKGDHELVEKIINKVVTSSSDELNAAKSSKLTPFISKILSQGSFWLGRVAYAKNDFTQAQKYFHEAIRLDDNNLLAKLGLGQAQLSRGSSEEATITFESIVRSNSKCLEFNYALGLLYSQLKSRSKNEQAIQTLERYIRLSNNRGLVVANMKDDEAYLNKEPVVLNAYLQLSQLYQSKDISQSLSYLQKAIESRKQIDLDAPLEVYNNIGVFNFIKNNEAAAAENFAIALEKADQYQVPEDSIDEAIVDLGKDLRIPITYNLARSKESSSEAEAIETYNKLLEECPNYFSAKLRLLFLDAVSTEKTPKKELEEEIKALLQEHASNLEVRSFYGWFIKTFGKKIGLKPDADTQHQKETLVDYDSHDCYALISLANIYCVMAREIKSSKEEEKKKKYFLRAIELFTKVLSIDAKNVFAAQGLAIVYIENKEPNKGLDVLRKIRDSLNDISVYLNLGHVLVELKQYSKAIESYEIAYVRFTNSSDPKILSFLGRSWYLRGLAEKKLGYLKKGLEYTEEAWAKSSTNKSALLFNVAFVKFQIADFLSKSTPEQRTIDDVKEAITNLNDAISDLNALASDEEKHPPFPKAELKSRANMGTTTLLKRLDTCLEETKENVNQLNSKIEEAKKLRQEEESRKAQEAEEELAVLRAKQEEMAKERAVLQEQAQQWAEEARSNVVVESDDDNAPDDDKKDGKKKKGKKAQANGKKGGKKGGRKKKDFINDSDGDDAPPSEDNEPEEPNLPSGDEEEEAPKKTQRKKRTVADDDDEDASENTPAKKRKQFKSQEIVEDSSDDGNAEDEDGLF